MPQNNRYAHAGMLASLFLIAALPLLIYYPGINGPFIFDDFSNIVQNRSLHIENFSPQTLQEAAKSLSSGPFGRPLAALSFAFNYYLSNNLDDPSGFKLFNVIIHSLNSLLVFWFMWLLLTRLREHPARPFGGLPENTPVYLAGFCALIWAVHPIQLTSILYVVQRMTSMASLFMLLALISYISARNAQLQGQQRKTALWLAGVPLWAIFALLSKETGLLLFPYIIVIELCLFSNASPWNHWHELNKKTQRIILSAAGLALILVIGASILYSLPRYNVREFTMLERLLTEGRVLIFYITQILIPRLSSFGIYHDDIAVSLSLLQPWTTLPAIILVIALLLSAFPLRHKLPLLSFGILWFFASHVLESTLFPLELTHEHRNYLASLGIILILIQGLILLHKNYHDKRVWLFIPVIVVFLSLITAVRSHQWKDTMTLYQAQVWNHPESPRAWGDLSSIYIRNNQLEKALSAAQRAALIDPYEPGYFIKVYLYMQLLNLPQPESLNEKMRKAIHVNPGSILLSAMFHKINDCIDSSCRNMQATAESWNRTILEATDSALYIYFLGNNLAAQGRFDEALDYLNTSIKQAPVHLSPYITKINIFLKQGEISKARETYATLENISLKLYGIKTKKVLDTGKQISEFEQNRNASQKDNIPHRP